MPLLERTKFASIYTSNLDEYFMVRVAGLHDQIEAGVERPASTGARHRRHSRRSRAVHELDAGSPAASPSACSPALPSTASRQAGRRRQRGRTREPRQPFRRVIFPALTPLAVGPGQPFPYISNLSLSLGVIVQRSRTAATRRSPG